MFLITWMRVRDEILWKDSSSESDSSTSTEDEFGEEEEYEDDNHSEGSILIGCCLLC